MLNIRFDLHSDGLEGIAMYDFGAMIFLLFLVVLIGIVPIFIIVTGIGVVCNSVSSLIETLDSFVHRNEHSEPPLMPQTKQKPARYLP